MGPDCHAIYPNENIKQVIYIKNVVGWQSEGKKKTPNFHWVFSFWDPATTYSPGPSPAKYHRR